LEHALTYTQKKTCSMCMQNIYLLCLLKIAFKYYYCFLCRYLHLIAFLNLRNIHEKKFWDEIVGINFTIFIYKKVSFFFCALFSFRNTLLIDFCLLLIDWLSFQYQTVSYQVQKLVYVFPDCVVLCRLQVFSSII